jgi:uncharacterized protein involved in high-affinity Fe2+ transport
MSSRKLSIKKLLTVGVIALLAVFALGACSTTDGGGAIAPSDTAGFEEFPLGDDQVIGALNVAGVYFQPVDMEPAMAGTLPKAQSSMHIEADISAAEGNELGYGVGDFVPNLTVTYEIEDASGTLVQEGAFMPMNADDGPHYGNNIKLEPGTYTVRFIIDSPVSQGFLLHTDAETGVDGKFWTVPIVAEFTNFEWDGRSW